MITPRHLVVFVVALVAHGAARADTPPPPPAAPHSLIVHVAPLATVAGAPIELEAMIDAPFAETLSARWRAIGETTYQDVPFERSSAGGWYASIPGAHAPGIEYYLRGVDANGAEVTHFASATAPHVVRVDATVADNLELLDRARLAGHEDEIAFELVAHDFGNRYAIPDRFVRTELSYTHRFLRVIHQVVFGFGTVDGRTPEPATTTGDGHYEALRYGFGEIRLRLHASVFVDARAALGVSTQGFTGGTRGVLTFGKPWRSCLQFGGEYLGDLGPTAWVRLQWDTAAPLLMGASIVRTDLPGAMVSASGLYIAYDLGVRLADRFTMKAQVSYGSRDGAAHLGGGFGAAVDF